MTTDLDILLAEHDAEIDALEATIRQLRARDDRPRFVVSHPFDLADLADALRLANRHQPERADFRRLLADVRRVQRVLDEWDRANQLAGGRALND